MYGHVRDLPEPNAWILWEGFFFFIEEQLCPLLIECLPVNINEGLAVHAVNVEDSIQMIHLMLEDSSWPATGLPWNIFTLFIDTCMGNMHSQNKFLNSLNFALIYRFGFFKFFQW